MTGSVTYLGSGTVTRDQTAPCSRRRWGTRSADIGSAPLLAASIFLDILNVFLFFLQIFSSQEKD